MKLQENVHYMDKGQEHKWEVCQLLTFLAYAKDEPDYGPDAMPLIPGDTLQVCPGNTCGMGIDVVRLRDGCKTMVWPEEVE